MTVVVRTRAWAEYVEEDANDLGEMSEALCAHIEATTPALIEKAHVSGVDGPLLDYLDALARVRIFRAFGAVASKPGPKPRRWSKGYRYNAAAKKRPYEAVISYLGKQIFIGSYANEEEAQARYEAVAERIDNGEALDLERKARDR